MSTAKSRLLFTIELPSPSSPRGSCREIESKPVSRLPAGAFTSATITRNATPVRKRKEGKQRSPAVNPPPQTVRPLIDCAAASSNYSVASQLHLHCPSTTSSPVLCWTVRYCTLGPQPIYAVFKVSSGEAKPSQLWTGNYLYPPKPRRTTAAAVSTLCYLISTVTERSTE